MIWSHTDIQPSMFNKLNSKQLHYLAFGGIWSKLALETVNHILFFLLFFHIRVKQSLNFVLLSRMSLCLGPPHPSNTKPYSIQSLICLTETSTTFQKLRSKYKRCCCRYIKVNEHRETGLVRWWEHKNESYWEASASLRRQTSPVLPLDLRGSSPHGNTQQMGKWCVVVWGGAPVRPSDHPQKARKCAATDSFRANSNIILQEIEGMASKNSCRWSHLWSIVC